ncbi:MAG: hypothetical protein ACPHJ1_08805, partial [Ilumatobacteraceae bacterium]
TLAFSADEASEVAVGVTETAFVWRSQSVRLPMGGAVNMQNAIAALDAADLLGVDPAVAASALADCPPAPGRFEPVVGARWSSDAEGDATGRSDPRWAEQPCSPMPSC